VFGRRGGGIQELEVREQEQWQPGVVMEGELGAGMGGCTRTVGVGSGNVRRKMYV
jgi:hypothetical protein